jgi:hypothetical protein
MMACRDHSYYCNHRAEETDSEGAGAPRAQATKFGEKPDRNANGALQLSQGARGNVAYADASISTPIQDHRRSP